MSVEVLGFGAVVLVVLLVFAALVAGLIWLGVVQARRNRERRAALAALATAKGYEYVPEDPTRTTLFASTPFGIGDSRTARDLVWGVTGGKPFETFAYTYETHTTDSDGHRTTTTHRYQITWIPLPAPLPTMRFSADNAMKRLFAKMGAKDLEVESHEFNQRWKVWCADDRVGHAVLTPTVINGLLAPWWMGRGIVIESRLLMTYVSGHTNLEDLEHVVASLYDIADGVPEFLWEDQSP